jgi:small subunit ribosomal protein S2
MIQNMGMEETIIKEGSVDATQEKQPEQAGNIDKSLEEMIEAGLHFGHKTSKTHPKMKPYITGVRNTVHIINVEKTKEKLDQALAVVEDMVSSGKNILLVGTKVQVKETVRGIAEQTGMPYVVDRWIGGLLTNFEEISKRTAHLKDLEWKLANEEEAAKYTKWERHEMQEEVNKLEIKFGGVKNLEKLPDAMFVFDLDENQLAVKEAKQQDILVFGLCDTNCDPSVVDYAVPGNDDAVSSVKYIAEKVKEAIARAKAKNPQHIT